MTIGDLWTIKDHQLGLCSSEDVGKAKGYWTAANARVGCCDIADIGQVKVVWTMEDFRAGRCKCDDVGAKKQAFAPPVDDFSTRLAVIEDLLKNGKVPSARDEYRKVFFLIGGTAALAEWALANKEKFYNLHAKLVPQTVEHDLPKEALVIRLSWLVNRPGWDQKRHHDALRDGTTLNIPAPAKPDVEDAEVIDDVTARTNKPSTLKPTF